MNSEGESECAEVENGVLYQRLVRPNSNGSGLAPCVGKRFTIACFASLAVCGIVVRLAATKRVSTSAVVHNINGPISAVEADAASNVSNVYSFPFKPWSVYIDANWADPKSGIEPAGIVPKAIAWMYRKCPGVKEIPGHMTVIYGVSTPLNNSVTERLQEVVKTRSFKPFNLTMDLAPIHVKGSYDGTAISGHGWKFGDYNPYKMRFDQLQIAPSSGNGTLLKVYNAVRREFGGGDVAAEGAFSPHISILYLPLNNSCFNFDDAKELFIKFPELHNLTIPVRQLTIMNSTGPPQEWKVFSRVDLAVDGQRIEPDSD